MSDRYTQVCRSSDEDLFDNERTRLSAFLRTRPQLGPRVWSQSNDTTSLCTQSKDGSLSRVGSLSRAMSTRSRLVRLGVFIVLELLWIVFALIVHFVIVETPSNTQLVVVGNNQMSRDALFKSGLATVAIIWQLIALIPIADIVKETFAGEWKLMLAHTNGSIDSGSTVDRVSTLVFGFADQLRHVLSKGASFRYRLAFVVFILAFALQALAPGSITTTGTTISTKSNAPISVGTLMPNQTALLSNSDPISSPSDNRVILRGSLLDRAVRYVSVASSEKSRVGFQFASNYTLFGMPPRNMLTGQLSYRTGAVFYNFSCQWLAPNIVSTNTKNSTGIDDWKFEVGGDAIGSLDEVLVDKADTNGFGAYPLILQSGLGSRNGSFAWLVSGGNSSSGTALDLSSIPDDRKTTNSSGIAPSDPINTVNAVLFCDPNMELGYVDVILQNQALSAVRIEDGTGIPTGSDLDWNETSRMLGSSLNELVLNNDFTNLPIFNSDDGNDMSRLAFELLFLLSAENASAAAVPQSLGNISTSLNWYTSIVGSNVYLDGTLGSANVTMLSLQNTQRLEWNLSNLLTSGGLTFLIALLILLLINVTRGGEYLPVTFSLATALTAVHLLPRNVQSISAVMNSCVRIFRIFAFLILELVWLALGLIVHFHTIKLSSTSFSEFSQDGLSTVAIIWQLLALVPVLSIITETFSSEWSHIHAQFESRPIEGASSETERHVDCVSMLTSGLLDRTKHVWNRRASWRFRIAFVISLLSIVLKTIAPGAINTSADIVSTGISLQIGSVPVLAAFDAEAQLTATRFAYLAMIEDTPLNYQLATNNSLFGLPPRTMLSERLSYRTEAVHYDFECQWIAPAYIPSGDNLTDLSYTEWIIETRTGAVQVQPNLFIGDGTYYFDTGFFALEAMSDSGALNGTFAWILIGGNSTDGGPFAPFNLDSIPDSNKTYNASGFEQNSVWTTASVLLCDPHMEIGTVDVVLKDHTFSISRAHANESGMTGNGDLDWNTTALVISAGLNGLPSDSATANLPSLDTNGNAGSSLLAFNLALQILSSTSPVTLQSLSNISSTLNWATTVVGANVYFSGSLGNTTIESAHSFETIERFECIWMHWGASLGTVVIMTVLLGILAALQAPGTSPVVPLTLTAAVVVSKGGLLESHDDIFMESMEGRKDNFNAQELYQKYLE